MRSYKAFTTHRASEPARRAVEAAVSDDRPRDWLNEEVEIRGRASDPSDMGYALVDKEAIRFGGGGQVVRLDYAAADGQAFSLFVSPRWDNEPDPILQTRRNGVAAAFWVDGPLAATVLSRLPPDETRGIAEAARRAMKVENGGQPVVKPGPAREGPGGGGISLHASVGKATAQPPVDGHIVGGTVNAN